MFCTESSRSLRFWLPIMSFCFSVDICFPLLHLHFVTTSLKLVWHLLQNNLHWIPAIVLHSSLLSDHFPRIEPTHLRTNPASHSHKEAQTCVIVRHFEAVIERIHINFKSFGLGEGRGRACKLVSNIVTECVSSNLLVVLTVIDTSIDRYEAEWIVSSVSASYEWVRSEIWGKLVPNILPHQDAYMLPNYILKNCLRGTLFHK